MAGLPAIRAAFFAPDAIEYSTEQDDFCQKLMLEAAGYLFSKNRNRHVFLDGRPFSRAYQIENVIRAAEAIKQPRCILECICSEEIARQRIAAQAGQHPAGNRDYDLYLQIKARFEEIVFPKTVINTDEPLATCIELALHALNSAV